MADLVIVAANVKETATTVKRIRKAGATIAPGQPVYADPSDSDKAKPADANASAVTARAEGIALNAATLDQPVAIAVGGKVKLGAGTKGVAYQVSATAGGIAPVADQAAGWWHTHLGVSVDGDEFLVQPLPSEIQQ